MDRKCKRRLRLDAVPTIFDECLIEELRKQRCGEKRKPPTARRKTGKYEMKLQQIKQLLYEDVKYNMELEKTGICSKIELPETLMVTFGDGEDGVQSIRELPDSEPELEDQKSLEYRLDPEMTIETVRQTFCVSILKKPEERNLTELEGDESESEKFRDVPPEGVCENRTIDDDEKSVVSELPEVARLKKRIEILELDLATVNKRLLKAKINNTNLLNALAEFVDGDDIDILREAFDVNK